MRHQYGPPEARLRRGGKITKNDMRGRIKAAVHQATLGKETRDLVMAIGVLREMTNELIGKVNARAVAKNAQRKTFQEWRQAGYTVILGQRHTGRNEDGICTFLPSQVTPVTGRTGNNRKYRDYETDPDDMFDGGIDPWD